MRRKRQEKATGNSALQAAVETATKSLVPRRECSYTKSMKTAISLPDDVFAQADQLARRLRKSRSELYRDAVSEFIARHDPEAITEAMDRVAEQIDTRADTFSTSAARRVLGRNEW